MQNPFADGEISLSDFQLLKTLGEGGFAEVYHVREAANLKQSWAMKVFEKEKLVHRVRDVQRIRSEVRIH